MEYPTIATPADLTAMHPSEAWEQALRISFAPPEEVQAGMGWSVHLLRRFLSTERFYPSYMDIPKFCRLTGNELVIDWLTANTREPEPERAAPMLGCFELMERVALIFSASGEVAKKARAAVADRRITPAELRSVIKVLELSTSGNLRLLNELRAMAQELAQTSRRERVKPVE